MTDAMDLSAHGITVQDILRNPGTATLYEEAIRHEPGTSISDTGCLIAYSGDKTGRSPKDKRVVRHHESENDVWWGPVNFPLDEMTFAINRERAVDYLNTRPRLYCVDAFAGWDQTTRLKVRVICARPYHALFMNNMLIRPTDEELSTFGELGLCHLQRRWISREPIHHRNDVSNECRPEPGTQGSCPARHRIRR